jgi:F0F1-type ATP synthase assembly protein I
VGTEEPTSPSSPTPRKRPASGAGQISDILELPIMLVACIAIGGGLGYFLDSRFHTSPMLTLILGLIGFAAGIFQLLKRLSKDTTNDGGT